MTVNIGDKTRAAACPQTQTLLICCVWSWPQKEPLLLSRFSPPPPPPPVHSTRRDAPTPAPPFAFHSLPPKCRRQQEGFKNTIRLPAKVRFLTRHVSGLWAQKPLNSHLSSGPWLLSRGTQGCKGGALGAGPSPDQPLLERAVRDSQTSGPAAL